MFKRDVFHSSQKQRLGCFTCREIYHINLVVRLRHLYCNSSEHRHSRLIDPCLGVPRPHIIKSDQGILAHWHIVPHSSAARGLRYNVELAPTYSSNN